MIVSDISNVFAKLNEVFTGLFKINFLHYLFVYVGRFSLEGI